MITDFSQKVHHDKPDLVDIYSNEQLVEFIFSLFSNIVQR